MDVNRGYEPGLFVNEKKIAAFGIRVDRGVSLHGVAINVYNDLAPFKWIRQCGMSLQATSLVEEIARFTRETPHLSLPGLANRWRELLIEEFGSLRQETLAGGLPPPEILPSSGEPSQNL